MGKDINQLLSKTFDDTKSEPTKKSKDISSLLSKTFDIPDKNIVDGDVALTGGYGRGESKYDSISEPTQLLENLNQVRAERQGWLAEAGNAALGGIIGGALTAVETASYILDIPSHGDVIKSFADRITGTESAIKTIDDNFIGSTAKEMKETLYQEYLPIYRKNPDKLIDFNDSAFYWETFRSVTESAVGFGVAGMGAGALVKGAGTLAKYSAYMNRLSKGAETITQAAVRTGRALESGTAGRIATAYLTNHGESKMMALELYETAQKDIFDEYIQSYQQDHGGDMPSEDDMKEFQLDAKIAAGQQANAFMLTNKIFMATDYLALNRMFKSPTTAARNIQAKPPSTKLGQVGQAVKGNLSNAPKEAIEEAGQVAYQQEGQFQARKTLKEQGYNISDDELDSMSWIERMGEFITSEQALLEGAMGLISGPIQYTATQLPFENFSGQRKKWVDQQGVIESSKDYTEKNLYNIVTGEALAKDIEEKMPSEYSDEMKESLNEVAFKGLVNRNLAAGTVGKLEEAMLEMKQEQPEIAQGIDSKIKLMNQMENQYNNYIKKYSNPLQIMNFENNRELYEKQANGLKKYEQQTESKLNRIIGLANDLSGTNYTNAMVLDLPLGDFNRAFEKIVKEYEPVINEYNDIKKNQKELNKLIFENEKGEIQYKDFANNELLNRFSNVVDNIKMSTEDKITEYKKIQKAVKGDVVKSHIGRVIQQEEADLFKSQTEEAITKKGGAESAEDKVDRDRLQEGLDKLDLESLDKSVANRFNENFEDYIIENDILTLKELHEKRLEQFEKNLSHKELFENIAREQNIQTKYQELLDSVGGEEALEANINEAIARDEEKSQAEQDAILANIDQTKKVETVNNEVGSAVNYPSLKNEDVLQTSENHVEIDKNMNGVKLNYFARNKEFIDFLNSNTNKNNLPVRFEVETETKYLKPIQKEALGTFNSGQTLTKKQIENLPIKAIITDADNKKYTTSLFSVNRGKDNNKAANVETQLRTDIVNAFRKGITPMTTINYQYSGAYTSDGEQKNLQNIREIREAYEANKDVDDVPLYYVNTDGRIKDIATDTIIRDFVHTRVKTKGQVWAGVLMTHVTDSNGKKKPVKLNTASLTNDEMELITGLYTMVLTPSKVNNYNRKIGEIEAVKSRLSDADYAYLGENATVAELLNHLVLEGPFTKKINPFSQLYVEQGQIRFGEFGPYTLEEFAKTDIRNKFKAFLNRYKNRQVSFSKLNEDKKYKKLMLNKVITTDLAVDDQGEVFKSVTENANNPSNRYKTKALYVKTQLDNAESTIIEEKTTTPVVKPEENVNLADEINQDQNEMVKDMKTVNEDMTGLAAELSDELAQEQEVEDKISKAQQKKANSKPAKKKC